METICEIIVQSNTLNHLDLSGMQLQQSQLLKLSEAIKKNKILVAIHLSDNKI